MGTEVSRGAKILVLATLVLVLLLAGTIWLGCSSPDQTTTTAATSAGRPGSTVTTQATSPSATQSADDPAPATGPPVRYQEDNAYLVYTGVWTESVTPEDADGDFVFASQKSSVTVRFKGTSVAYIAKKAYVYSKASVTLDDRT